MNTPNTINTAGYPVILNGDHAEFEAEWAGKNPTTRPDWPLPSFDARDWAKHFVKCNEDMAKAIGTEELEARALTWFANSLMGGYDRGVAHMRESFRERSRWQRLLDVFR